MRIRWSRRLVVGAALAGLAAAVPAHADPSDRCGDGTGQEAQFGVKIVGGGIDVDPESPSAGRLWAGVCYRGPQWGPAGRVGGSVGVSASSQDTLDNFKVKVRAECRPDDPNALSPTCDETLLGVELRSKDLPGAKPEWTTGHCVAVPAPLPQPLGSCVWVPSKIHVTEGGAHPGDTVQITVLGVRKGIDTPATPRECIKITADC